MRVLIYSETDEAKAICEAERKQGNHASLRFAELFQPADTEVCDRVVVWNTDIARAYDGKAEVDYRGLTYTEADAKAQAEVIEKPVEKTKAKGK